MGKGKISPEAFASLLALPGKPFFPEIASASALRWIFVISPGLNVRSLKTPRSMSTRVELLTTAPAPPRKTLAPQINT